MKKINTTIIMILLSLTLSNFCLGQTYSNSDYFPHKDGDMWEYFYSDGPFYTDTAQVFNHLDSTDTSGNIYLTQTSRYINPIRTPAIPFADTMRYKIDTLHQVWGKVHELNDVIAFKLDAKQGDQWVLKTYYDNEIIMGYEMARIRSIYQRNIFGENYSVMNTFYYFTPDTLDTLGLVRSEEELAKGLGRNWKGGGDAPGRMDLIGAVIGGILYGDTTNVITTVNQNNLNILPSILELKQNYPNPFNSGTNINYSIYQNINVSITVYDIKGEQVYNLVDNKLHSPGNYSIYWNGKNKNNQEVASGVYFYSVFQNTKPVKTKSMLLIK